MNGLVGRCPVCGAERLKKKLSLFRCQGCGLRFRDRIWKVGSNEELNAKHFESPNEIQIDGWWYDLFENTRVRRLRSYVQDWSSGNKVLEVGVGNCRLLEELRRHGYSVVGTDLSETAQSLMKARGIDCLNGDDDLARESFDVVIASHVLEHVDSPLDFIAHLKYFMKKEGVLVIITPNADSLDAALPSWGGYEDYHLSFFNERSLRRLLKETDLRAATVFSYETFSAATITIARMFKLLTKKQTSKSELGANSDDRHRILLAVMGLVSKPVRCLVSRIGRGDEIIVIASRV